MTRIELLDKLGGLDAAAFALPDPGRLDMIRALRVLKVSVLEMNNDEVVAMMHIIDEGALTGFITDANGAEDLADRMTAINSAIALFPEQDS